MKNYKTLILVTLFIVIPGFAISGIFPPSSFEDCVLDGVKDAKNEAAVAAVQLMCARKFPAQSKSTKVNNTGKFICDLSKYSRPEHIDFSYDLSKRAIDLQGKKFQITRVSENALFSTLIGDDVLVFNFHTNNLSIQDKKSEQPLLFSCSPAR